MGAGCGCFAAPAAGWDEHDTETPLVAAAC